MRIPPCIDRIAMPTLAKATTTADETGHDSAVAGMFGRIASLYDFLNHLLSLGLDFHWRRVLVRNIPEEKSGTVLDLAAGTLDVSIAIARRYPQALVPALDFCHPMLERGLVKSTRRHLPQIMPVTADAKHLPLPDNSVDCITIAFGIRNIKPRKAAFAEMLRVLKPGGRACILEFGSGQERIWGGLYNFYLGRILPAIGKLCSGDSGAYAYLAETIRAFPPAGQFEDELRDSGFTRAWHCKLTSGIVCLHMAEKGEVTAS